MLAGIQRKRTIESISFEELKNIVLNIPNEYANNNQEWIKIIWGIAQTSAQNGYDGLQIADEFSKKSSKYTSIIEVQKVYMQNKGKITDKNGKIVKIDILVNNKCVIGLGSEGYRFINNTQYCELADFPPILVDIFTPPKPLPKAEISCSNGVHKQTIESISAEELKNIVLNIPEEYADNYQEWIKIIWAIAQTSAQNGYNGLQIADEFSRKSSKYTSITEVEKVYRQNKGNITAGTLIHLSKYRREKQNKKFILKDILKLCNPMYSLYEKLQKETEELKEYESGELEEILSQNLEYQDIKEKLAKEIKLSEEFENELIGGKRKVRDHDHLTGEFRGAAHSICNLNYKIPRFIPIFFHNFSGYDAHFLVKELGADGENITLIPSNEEKYISFSKHIKYDTGKNVEMRFLDSYRFLPQIFTKFPK